MNSMTWKILLLSIIALLITPTIAGVDRTIHFINIDFPALWILEGKLKGEGIADKAEQYFQRELKNFTYQQMNVPVNRAEYFMSGKHQETYCAVPHGKGFFKNSIESKIWAVISGHSFTAGRELIDKLKHNPQYVNDRGQLKLRSFLANAKGFLGIVAKGQRYPVVDQYIDGLRGTLIQENTNFSLLTGEKMIKAGHVEYTFDYESTISYLQLLGHEIDFLTIEELNHHQIPIVVGCNDTPLAREFIQSINKKIIPLREIGLDRMSKFHSALTFKRLKDYLKAQD